MTKTAIIIPTRYGSTRLPGKPLLKVKEKTIINYVYEIASKVKSADVVAVATDDVRIEKEVLSFGGKCVMTSSDCKSGTDRIAQVIEKYPQYAEYDNIINLQGDEPQITKEAIELVIEALNKDNIDISTLVREIKDFEQINNPNCVKCVFDNNFQALYFSRCPIPYERNKNKSPYYAHIGIYGYKKDALIKMTKLEQSNLEMQESLEQLRALQNGLKIAVSIVDFNPIGIDTIEDYEKFKKIVEG